MADGPHFEKLKRYNISAKVPSILLKFDTTMHLDPLDPISH